MIKKLYLKKRLTPPLKVILISEWIVALSIICLLGKREGGRGGQYTVTYVFIRWADLKCKLHTRTIWVTLPLSSYQDCRKTYFINESDEDPLRMFEKGQSATLQVNPDINCANNKASLSFQAGDRELTLQNEMSAYWGLEVTRQWTGSTRHCILKVRNKLLVQKKKKN